MSNTIIVTGANGQLGSELRVLSQQLNDFKWIFTDVDSLDLTDQQAVEAFIDQHQPSYFVHCAAYTAVDKAEEQQDLAMAVNGTAPGTIAEACRTIGAKMIQISTDYVFDGTSSEVLTEAAVPNPQSVYGATKLAGEQLVQDSGVEHMIIRTAWVYSSFGNNFVKTMIRLGNERDNLGVVFDQIGSPTYAADLATCITQIISGNKFKQGVYHFSNEGVCSWYDFACAIMELKQINCEVRPIRSSAFPTPAKRPAMTVLDKAKITETVGIAIPHWRTSLKACLDLL